MRNRGEINRNRVFNYISWYWRAYLCSPSMRDIQAGAKIKSTSHVYYILGTLEDRGLLVPRSDERPVAARQIVPTWVRDALQSAKEG